MSTNVYYEPEKFNLQIIGMMEENLSYAFHMLVSWQHIPSGRVFWREDSGCSCPSPFEDEHFASPDNTSLTEITDSFSSGEAFTQAIYCFPADHGERTQFRDKTLSALANKPSVPNSNS